ncbi:hypothetical protein [Thalassoglobus polymorphus]|uniref:Uncharacterized protein n=1 Tax=Thalassoglobus polymorphus TaxID=2527994 RepID=A0A517QQ50_9PLAN|nr:hypothetical protein [Thalassoglobus polymorphus]QDT33756.1 hypothetical protein Mal48_30110 [Thalassoglobus polymorphus]
MPIKFRCPNCQQFLGISRSKAGSVTDCPTCGRTLRVPNLDGEVSPLPPPRLNFEDQDLQRALGALASLGPDGEPVDVPTAQDSHPEELLEAVESDQAENIPVIVAEPIPRSEPVDVASESEAATPVQLQEELAQLDMAIPILEPEEVDVRSGISIKFAILGTAAGLLLGILIGRLTVSGTSGSSGSSESAVNHAEKAKKEVVAPKAKPALPQGDDDVQAATSEVAGTLSYQSATGEVRPDKGGRVLILPAKNPSHTKLPGNGFRVGAKQIDQEVLAAAVKVLGGGFQLADDQGEFTFSNLAQGEYLILFASRYQSLDESQVASPNVQKILDLYFEHPTRVIGQVQHQALSIRVTSEKNQALEIEFGR